MKYLFLILLLPAILYGADFTEFTTDQINGDSCLTLGKGLPSEQPQMAFTTNGRFIALVKRYPTTATNICAYKTADLGANWSWDLGTVYATSGNTFATNPIDFIWAFDTIIYCLNGMPTATDYWQLRKYWGITGGIVDSIRQSVTTTFYRGGMTLLNENPMVLGVIENATADSSFIYVGSDTTQSATWTRRDSTATKYGTGPKIPLRWSTNYPYGCILNYQFISKGISVGDSIGGAFSADLLTLQSSTPTVGAAIALCPVKDSFFCLAAQGSVSAGADALYVLRCRLNLLTGTISILDSNTLVPADSIIDGDYGNPRLSWVPNTDTGYFYCLVAPNGTTNADSTEILSFVSYNGGATWSRLEVVKSAWERNKGFFQVTPQSYSSGGFNYVMCGWVDSLSSRDTVHFGLHKITASTPAPAGNNSSRRRRIAIDYMNGLSNINMEAINEKVVSFSSGSDTLRPCDWNISGAGNISECIYGISARRFYFCPVRMH